MSELQTRRPRRGTRAIAACGVVLFWGCIGRAAQGYPRGYDWRYMTVTSLLSSVRNPLGYRWAAAGFALCGLVGWWVTFRLGRGTEDARPASLWILRLGYCFMILAAALPGRWLPIPKAHEALAILAFALLCYGTIDLFGRRWYGGLLRERGQRRWWAAALAGLSVSPIVLAAVTQAYLFTVRPDLPWVSVAWRARDVPWYLSFAIWEWVTCAVLSVYMALLEPTAPASGAAAR